MTEAEWLAGTDPQPLLEFLRESGKVSDRKLRLLACAFCRRTWHLLPDQRPRRAVDLAERYADGGAGAAELAEAARQAGSTLWDAPTGMAARDAAASARDALDPVASRAVAAGPTAAAVAGGATLGIPRRRNNRPSRKWKGVWDRAFADEQRGQSGLIRDLFGNPFRTAAVDPAWLAWRGGTVARLVQAAYDERDLPSGHLDPARLVVLADALEEAGCADPALLGHLRSGGEHVRGCWAVDALLGKS
jgi:hypothetical protein